MNCSVADCEKPAAKSGLCWAHAKQRLRGQPLTTVASRHASPLDRLREAALDYADADADEDAEFGRAEDNLRKAARAYGVKGAAERIREALAAARRRGVVLGRPRKLLPDRALELLSQAGSVAAVAALLDLHPSTVRRAVRRARSAPRAET